MALSYIKEGDDHFLVWEDSATNLRVPLDFPGRQGVGRKSDLLKRALGKFAENTKVYDATAGLLRDAHHMTALGLDVVSFERHGELSSALQKALVDLPNKKLHLVSGDFIEASKLLPAADIVYLDPMFPEKKKSALPGKESQLLQMICSYPDTDDEALLLDAALAKATARVVVKRPLKAPNLADQKPHHFIEGKAIRYDVYLV